MYHFFRQARFLFGATSISLFFCLSQATADPIVITFDELQHFEEIRDFYSGGFGSEGTGPGPGLGIVFTNIGSFNAVAATDCYIGCNEPSAPNSLDLFGETTINVSGGFSTGFSFFYADRFNEDFTSMSISIFEGLDGTGALLTSVTLPDTGESFSTFSVGFSGIARSVAITTGRGTVFFDNMTFGSTTPVSNVPEPTTMLLLGTGLAGIAGKVRRRRKVI
jgi:hypothetical protein